MTTKTRRKTPTKKDVEEAAKGADERRQRLDKLREEELLEEWNEDVGNRYRPEGGGK